MPDGPDVPEMPSTPMAQPYGSRPPSASGERSRALGQGYVKISEVESTKRLNDALEKDNHALMAEIAEILRANLQLRDNIGCLEGMLGIEHDDDDDDYEEVPEAGELELEPDPELDDG